MLIMVASLALTGAAIFFGYFLAGTLQKIEYVAAPINWLIEHPGSVRVMIVTGIVLFPFAFFLSSLRLVRDLRAINTGLQNAAAGKFGREVKVGGRDELSRAADHLNRLSGEWDHDLAKITYGLEKIASGQFDYRIPEIPGNQLGEVALSLNRMSMQLKHSIEEERKAEKTKNDLITGVSHDLRTPLTSILGFLEVIENDRYQDEVEMRYYVNIAYEKALTLRRLIDELFEYTRINNGLPLERSELDMAGLIGQLAEEFVPLTEQAGMEIRLNRQAGELKIQADGGLLVRAYENIIANAIQYGRAGKYIDIEIAREEDLLVVRIQNYGDPIPEQDLPFIFDRFYRVEHSRSKQTGGTGLGLAITKSIVDVHGGSIAAHSSRTATFFETRFPISGSLQATQPSREQTADEDVPAGSGDGSGAKPIPIMSPDPHFEPKPRPQAGASLRQRRLLHSGAAAVPMIFLLLCGVILFSVKSSLTSEIMAEPSADAPATGDPAPVSLPQEVDTILATGRTDKEFTLLIHEYFFNEKKITVQYSMKYNPALIADLTPAKKSITPIFQLDESTKQAVPDISTRDSGEKLYKNGVFTYDFGQTPPDKFRLKVNVTSLLVVDELGRKSTIDGDWSFEMPVARNYKLKANGQGEYLKTPNL